MKPWISLLLLFSSTVSAVELMQWERIPLPVTLHVDQERAIFVERNVSVGYPATLQGKLRIQSAGGVVYLRASEAFPATRLQLRSEQTGELILLDITATAATGEQEPVKLVFNEQFDALQATHLKQEKPKHTSSQQDNVKQSPAYRTPLPVALTRYAAQQLYAPLRTVEATPGIQAVALRAPSSLTTILPGESVAAHPLQAWRLGEYTVTAVRLKNHSTRRIELDPRALQGNFYAATFQHHWLAARGSAEDTTVVYLVTRNKGFDRAIIPEPNAKSAEER